MSLKFEEYLKLCSKGELAVLKERFRSFDAERIESIRDNHKASCIHYAARAGCIPILEYLIVEKGVSPFLVSEVGATVLHDAAVKGKLEVIQWLINHTDLKTTIKDANGATILHLAAKFDRISLIEWILDREGIKAAKVQTYNGASCLHFACATGSFEAVKLILKAVPNYINLQMVNGVTPAYLTVQENKILLLKYLVKHGANINLRAEDGMNAIHVACQNGNLEMVQLLLDEYNANINEKDFNGATPLHYACTNGNSALVAYLLSNGASILIDKFGNTPLHDCSIGGFLECARLLVASNCDASLRDNQGMTCSDLAEALGYREFAKEMRKFEQLFLKKHERENGNNQIEEDDAQQRKLLGSHDLEGMPTPTRRSLKKKSTFGSANRSENSSISSKSSISSNTNTTFIFNKDLNNNNVNGNVNGNYLLKDKGGSSEPGKVNSVISPMFTSSIGVSTSTPSSNEPSSSSGESVPATTAAAPEKPEPSGASSLSKIKDRNSSLSKLSKQKAAKRTASLHVVRPQDVEKPAQNQTVFRIIRKDEGCVEMFAMDKCLETFCESKRTLSKDSPKASTDSLIKSVKAEVNNEIQKKRAIYEKLDLLGSADHSAGGGELNANTLARKASSGSGRSSGGSGDVKRPSGLHIFNDAENEIISSTAIEDSLKLTSPIDAVDLSKKRYSSSIYCDLSLNNPIKLNHVGGCEPTNERVVADLGHKDHENDSLNQSHGVPPPPSPPPPPPPPLLHVASDPGAHPFYLKKSDRGNVKSNTNFSRRTMANILDDEAKHKKSWHVPSGYMEELQRQIKIREKLYENIEAVNNKYMNDAFLVDENNNANVRADQNNNNNYVPSSRMELKKKHQHRSNQIYANEDADKSLFNMEALEAFETRMDKRAAPATLGIGESEALKKLRSLRVSTEVPAWKRELIEQKRKRRSLALLTPNDLIAGFKVDGQMTSSRSNPWISSAGR